MCLVLLARNVSLWRFVARNAAAAAARQFWPHKKRRQQQTLRSVSPSVNVWAALLSWQSMIWVGMTCLVHHGVSNLISGRISQQPHLGMEMSMKGGSSSPSLITEIAFCRGAAARAQPPMMKLRGWYDSDLRVSPQSIQSGCLGLLREIWAHCEQLYYVRTILSGGWKGVSL